MPNQGMSSGQPRPQPGPPSRPVARSSRNTGLPLTPAQIPPPMTLSAILKLAQI